MKKYLFFLVLLCSLLVNGQNAKKQQQNFVVMGTIKINEQLIRHHWTTVIKSKTGKDYEFSNPLDCEIFKNNQKTELSISDLKVGEKVGVVGKILANGLIEATAIFIINNQPLRKKK